jgi:acetyltransferase
MGSLRNMLNAKTVALFGGTGEGGGVGQTILANLTRAKIVKVHLVGPECREMMGVDAYGDITRIPGHGDLAVVASPAPEVPGIVDECGRAGVDGLVIISAGFREIGEEGRRLEERVDEARRRYSMRVLGPNCLGFMRPGSGLNTTYLKCDPLAGDIAFLSQSGAVGNAVVDWAANAGVGFSMIASLGSTIDVDFGDLIDFLGDDEATRSILIYMEGVRNARRFVSAARAFARRKPIIVLKSGRFAEAAGIAHTHTGATGDDAVYDAVFRRVGIVRVREMAQLFNTPAVLQSERLPQGPRLAIVTDAGGPGIMATDLAIELGGELARLSAQSIEAISACAPPHWSRTNPVDILGDADIPRYTKSLQTCLRDPMVDGVLVIYVPQPSAPSSELAGEVVRLAKDAWKPVIAAWMGAKEGEQGRKVLIENDIPAYETPEDAVRTYFTMYTYRRNLAHLYETPADLPAQGPDDRDRLKARVQAALSCGRSLLDEEESKDLLLAYGVPAALYRFAEGPGAAAAIAGELGYPVAMKVLSDIPDKGDGDWLVSGLTSEGALKQACESLLQSARERAPQAVIRGVAVRRMIGPWITSLCSGAEGTPISGLRFSSAPADRPGGCSTIFPSDCRRSIRPWRG